MAKRIAAFASVQGVFWLVAWLAGYDFNSRNFTVAYWGFFGILLGLLIASFPGLNES